MGLDRGDRGRRLDPSSSISVRLQRCPKRRRRVHRRLSPLADRLLNERDRPVAWPSFVGHARLGVLLGAASSRIDEPSLLRNRLHGHRGLKGSEHGIRHCCGGSDLPVVPSLLGSWRGACGCHLRRAVTGRDLQRRGRHGRTDCDCLAPVWHLAHAEPWFLWGTRVGRRGHGTSRSLVIRTRPGRHVAGRRQEKDRVSRPARHWLAPGDGVLRQVPARPDRQPDLPALHQLPVRRPFSGRNQWPDVGHCAALVGFRTCVGPVHGRRCLVPVETADGASAAHVWLRLLGADPRDLSSVRDRVEGAPIRVSARLCGHCHLGRDSQVVAGASRNSACVDLVRCRGRSARRSASLGPDRDDVRFNGAAVSL